MRSFMRSVIPATAFRAHFGLGSSDDTVSSFAARCFLTPKFGVDVYAKPNVYIRRSRFALQTLGY